MLELLIAVSTMIIIGFVIFENFSTTNLSAKQYYDGFKQIKHAVLQYQNELGCMPPDLAALIDDKYAYNIGTGLDKNCIPNLSQYENSSGQLSSTYKMPPFLSGEFFIQSNSNVSDGVNLVNNRVPNSLYNLVMNTGSNGGSNPITWDKNFPQYYIMLYGINERTAKRIIYYCNHKINAFYNSTNQNNGENYSNCFMQTDPNNSNKFDVGYLISSGG